MVKLTLEELRAAMKKAQNIRNVCMVNLLDEELSSLTGCMLESYGVVVYDPEEDTLETTGLDICKRCITIEPVVNTAYYKRDPTQQGEMDVEGILVNILEAPQDTGQICDLIITDGALVVIDSVYGPNDQTHQALGQLLKWGIKPTFFMDHMNRPLFEYHIEPEDLYQILLGHVERLNSFILSVSSKCPDMGEVRMDPSKGSVGFGSGLHGWAFTLKQFSEIYAGRFKIDLVKLMNRLWGENFFNVKTKMWAKIKDDDNRRSFCMYVLDPIYKVFDVIMNFKKEETEVLLQKIGVTIKHQDSDKTGKALLKLVMQSWLPAGAALLQIIAIHLPSPVVAQKYRMKMLYEGPHDDEAALGVKNCDPEAPLMMYISKMVPTAGAGSYALGRVFSGKIGSRMKTRVMKPEYKPGSCEVL